MYNADILFYRMPGFYLLIKTYLYRVDIINSQGILHNYVTRGDFFHIAYASYENN